MAKAKYCVTLRYSHFTGMEINIKRDCRCRESLYIIERIDKSVDYSPIGFLTGALSAEAGL